MNMFLRAMLSSDSETVLRWRNDPETRRNSINTAEVSPDEHARWFARVLADQPRRNFMADIDGISIGVVRLDWSEDSESCDLSFMIAPEYRGRGYGFAIVEHAVQGMQNVRVCAEVKMSNVVRQQTSLQRQLQRRDLLPQLPLGQVGHPLGIRFPGS